MVGRSSGVICVLAIAALTMSAGAADAQKRKLRTIDLLSPAPNVVITQNDPTTGCTDDATRGFGYMIQFEWSDSKTLRGKQTYTLTVQHAGSLPDTFDGLKSTTFDDLACNFFVIDQNLSNWTWQVNVINAKGRVLGTSEQRPFSFAPCRLASGQACNAP
jgi:hypothetical protein